jgi:hypothetical protein
MSLVILHVTSNHMSDVISFSAWNLSPPGTGLGGEDRTTNSTPNSPHPPPPPPPPPPHGSDSRVLQSGLVSSFPSLKSGHLDTQLLGQSQELIVPLYLHAEDILCTPGALYPFHLRTTISK